MKLTSLATLLGAAGAISFIVVVRAQAQPQPQDQYQYHAENTVQLHRRTPRIPESLIHPVAVGTDQLQSHDHLLKATLHYIATTVNHTLETFGGETLNTLRSDAVLQNQTKFLKASVITTLHDIFAFSLEPGDSTLVRRASGSDAIAVSLDDIFKTDAASFDMTKADLSDHASDIARARGLCNSLSIIAATLHRSLHMFDGTLYKKLLIPSTQEKLLGLRDSIKEQILEMSNRLHDLLNSRFVEMTLLVFIFIAVFYVGGLLIDIASEGVFLRDGALGVMYCLLATIAAIALFLKIM